MHNSYYMTRAKHRKQKQLSCKQFSSFNRINIYNPLHCYPDGRNTQSDGAHTHTHPSPSTLKSANYSRRMEERWRPASCHHTHTLTASVRAHTHTHTHTHTLTQK